MYVGISELHRERNDLSAALHDLQRSQDLGQHAGLPQNRYRWCVAMARVRQAQGDSAGELDLLDEAERLYISDFFPNVRPISAMKARVWIAQGRLGEALSWASEQGLSPEDNLSYLREYEHVTLARLLWPSTRVSVPSGPFIRRLDSWIASCERRTKGSGREALLRFWCYKRLPIRCATTSLLPFGRWNVP